MVTPKLIIGPDDKLSFGFQNMKAQVGLRVLEFASVQDFVAWGNTSRQNVNGRNYKVHQSLRETAQYYIDRKDDWFGLPTPESLEELNQIDQYRSPQLIDEAQQDMSDQLRRLASMQTFLEAPTKKMRWNPFGIGVFSFDKAATGLRPLLYSEALEKQVSRDEVDFSREADGILTLKADGSPVEKKFVTSVRDVYAAYEKVPVEGQHFVLYIHAGASSSVSGPDMAFNAAGVMAFAQLLTEQGHSVEINTLVGTVCKKSKKLRLANVRVKGFDDPLNVNEIAKVVAEPSFYRWKGFNGMVGMANFLNEAQEEMMGNAAPIETMQWCVKQFEQRPFFFFGRVSTRQATLSQLNRLINDFSSKNPPRA
ncbi:hypothetical protein SAMN05421823_11932 [Catalinimonas alkaloidigena]|uniref:DUF7192 domain-containing protein n=1 Tax=Catalinimonas alkaloidigena TaxID=1075417 RepID=A0A1G9V6W0_9BACT|nr:hypothetical protein [Catalinimonas alkaloidigena]SDM67787.1 hypothetical protein SAMN05421823_11932 [Catalinimonas alkaloidigena]